MAPDPGTAKRRLFLAIQVITVSAQLLELAAMIFAPDIKTFGPATSDLHDIGRQFRSSYDFIIVGSKSSGAVIANRLSQLQHWSVLLLEAAQDESSAFDGPTGNVYLPGTENDYGDWAEFGNPGWDYETVLKYFKKTVDMRVPEHIGSEQHGVGDQMTVEEFKSYSPITDAILKTSEALGNQFQFSKLNGFLRNGLSCCVSRAFLRPARLRKNLDISYNSYVDRVEIDPNTTSVSGVAFRKFGKQYFIRSNKEVILSAGAVRSAHVLLLSGVGPEKHLQDVGVPVISNLPVGQDLQSHVGIKGVTYTHNKQIPGVISRVLNLKETFHDYFDSGQQNIWEAIAFLRTKYAKQDGLPDAAVFLSGKDRNSDNKDSFRTLTTLLKPKSRGFVKIKSKDPTNSPIVEPNILSDSKDVNVLVEAIKIGFNLSSFLQEYDAGMNLNNYKACEQFPVMSTKFLKCVVDKYATSLRNYVGTCKMGAVVDGKLKVRGVTGLRIADSSIMPSLVSADLTATCVMIGEKASDLILDEWSMMKETPQVQYC